MDCCRPSRRQALIWGSLAAAAPIAATVATASPASAQTSSSMLVTDLEVATVTDTSVVITWFTGSATATDQYGFPAPVQSDTELQIGLIDATTLTVVPGSFKTVLQDATPTAYHYAEVSSLTPGTFYAYVALSGGQQAQPSSMQFPVGAGGSLDYPGTFTTLETPPGRYLFTLALSNDLHMGEGESRSSSSRSARPRSTPEATRSSGCTRAATWSATTRTARRTRSPGRSAPVTSTTPSTRTTCSARSPTGTTPWSGTSRA